MKTTRLLLPFTHGIDMDVLEYAVLLAKSRDAILVPLALIHVPEGRRSGGARLEHVQQSKDFLEATKHKAARHAVPLERFEIFTNDVVESIHSHAQELQCEDILLFVRDGDGILLSTHEVKRMMETGVHKLCITRLDSEGRKQPKGMPFRRFSHWLIDTLPHKCRGLLR